MTERIIQSVLFFLYSAVTTWGTGYAVFHEGKSGWWFVLTVFLIILYAGLNSDVEKKD